MSDMADTAALVGADSATLATLEAARTELARVRRDLAEFAYTASHHLAEPCAVIAGYVRLLGDRHGDRLDPEGSEFMRAILAAVGRTDQLIEELRAFSRVGTRGGPFEDVACADAAREAADLLGPAIEEHRAKLDIGELPTVEADRAQLVQLFRTLLTNALQFRSGERPHITITAEREERFWRLAVSDNGIGVPPGESERIFRMFERADNGPDLEPGRSGPGSGAGLAIARRIVERHGGSIWVRSAPGGGSSFYFTLPEQQESRA
jgi:signal transduction histidine kinase